MQQRNGGPKLFRSRTRLPSHYGFIQAIYFDSPNGSLLTIVQSRPVFNDSNTLPATRQFNRDRHGQPIELLSRHWFE